jgi:hypothetical protein
MEELESHQEHVEEQVNETAEHSKERWVLKVALGSAIFAALAAVCSLMAGHQEHDAMEDTIRASDQWAYYQAEGIKQAIVESRVDAFVHAPTTAPAERKKVDHLKDQVSHYEDKRKDIKKDADELVGAAIRHDRRHSFYAASVTLFQVGIATLAISLLTKVRRFSYVGVVLGLCGAVVFGYSLITK